MPRRYVSHIKLIAFIKIACSFHINHKIINRMTVAHKYQSNITKTNANKKYIYINHEQNNQSCNGLKLIWKTIHINLSLTLKYIDNYTIYIYLSCIVLTCTCQVIPFTFFISQKVSSQIFLSKSRYYCFIWLKLQSLI